MNRKCLLYAFFQIIIILLSLLFLSNDYLKISLLLSTAFALNLLIFVVRISEGYINAVTFFVIFYLLYGLSGPINVIWGKGLHKLFFRPYQVQTYLFFYFVSSIGLVLGFILSKFLEKEKLKQQKMKRKEFLLAYIRQNNSKIKTISVFLIALSSVFEIINLSRIGGIKVLFMGKAFYQSRIADMNLSLPSTIFFNVGLAYIGIYLSYVRSRNLIKSKNKIKYLLFYLLISSPYLIINLILGERGKLVAIFLILITSIYYFDPLVNIKPKLVIISLIFYVILAFLFANRAIVGMILENPNEFFRIAFSSERLIESLNPGSNEFGAAFGNFSQFINLGGLDKGPEFGMTYIKGLVTPIPSIIYPGEKPIQITYLFRNEFFPTEIRRGSIASTGFSALLEAYMNFKTPGIFFIYLAIGFALIKYENDKYQSFNYAILYISCISQVQSFHRGSFSGLFSNVILTYFVIFVSSIFLKIRSFDITNKEVNNL